MTILKINRSNKFRQDGGYFFAGKFFKVLVNEHIDKSLIIFMKNKIIKHKTIDCIVNLCKQPLDLLSRYSKILVNHLLKIRPLFNIGVHILGDDVSDLFKCEHIMRSFVLFVESDTAFDLADSGYIGASETAAHLYHFSLMDVTYIFLIFWVSAQHY
jgi:hypothetical protein